ncbi:MAG: isoleucine--tRNA ligase, partial [Gammaproteobacteria bacterium]|nr:isoleucine--tRNA ligase [Gammaproteobacteria bacterium]
FLAWTTTPWTVPSNTALALNPALTYAEAETEGRRVIVARDLVERVLGEDARIVREHDARALAGVRYARPLEVVPVPDGSDTAWRIILEDFVTAEDGTGIVHIAPAFGADDYAAGQRHGLPLMRSIDDAGRFHEGLPLVGGMFVKDADPLLVEELDRRGNLLRAGRVAHSYPHCWRCQSPLLYIARESWFAATSTLKDEMLAINRETAWYPPEIGEGRMGEWLAGNVDWALSRDRYWGTPLPVWVCDRDDEITEWIGSLAELEERAGPLGEDFDPHRPFIDEVTWPCSGCGGTMRRASPVVDVWFDSGAMPYAQWHYPFENSEHFERHFPADFISEGLDQTRGWFYSLMAISAMLGRGMAFRNVLVNDLVLDAEGRKMSKTKGNAVDPWEAVGAYGADPLRWYFVTVSNPWVPKRYDERGIAEVARKFFDTLFNTYRFFALYANVEGWRSAEGEEQGDGAPEPMAVPREASLLDRWMLSRLHRLVAHVRADLDDYQFTPAYRKVAQFVDEDLSNWYVRRSRPRYWGKTGAADADAAFRTLHLALRTVGQLIAPAAPFTADWLHRALTGGESVHLSILPEADEGCLDDGLEREMDAVRQLVTLGRAAREQAGVRVRQPLRTLHAAIPGVALRAPVLAVLREELNVKQVVFVRDAGDLLRLEARPNFRTLGPRFQRHSNAAAAAIRALGQPALRAWRGGQAGSITPAQSSSRWA